MGKIVRLTETDLNRLVKRIIKEQDSGFEDDFEFDSKVNDISRRGESGDLKHESNEHMVLLEGFNSKSVQKAISNLPKSIKFVAFLNCEYADFSEVDLCNFPELSYVNLKGTDNNFEETQGDCFEQMFDGFVKHN